MVDSSDPGRLLEAQEVLKKLLSDERLRGVPLMVLANKTDLPNALNIQEVQILALEFTMCWKFTNCCVSSDLHPAPPAQPFQPDMGDSGLQRSEGTRPSAGLPVRPQTDQEELSCCRSRMKVRVLPGTLYHKVWRFQWSLYSDV